MCEGGEAGFGGDLREEEGDEEEYYYDYDECYPSAPAVPAGIAAVVVIWIAAVRWLVID